MRKIWEAFTSLLIMAIMVLAFLLIGMRFIGFDLFVVLSGSMEPVYKTGSVIYVKGTDTASLEEGDIITFYINEDTIATHRIVELVQENGETMYRTKGDANENTDAKLVAAGSIIGQPKFAVPYLGYLADYMQTKAGKYMSIAVGAFVLLLVFVPDLLFDGEEDEKKKKTKKNKENDSIKETNNEKE